MAKKHKPKKKVKVKARSRAPVDPTTASALGLANEALRGYGVRRRSADAAAQGSTESLNAREAAVPGRYADVQGETSKADANITRILGTLGPAADPIRAVLANEQGSGLARSARAKAAELADIGSSKSSVQRIRSSQQAQAGQDYQETLRTISGETAKAQGDIAKTQAQLHQQDVNSRRTTRTQIRGQNKTQETQLAGQASTAATAAANRAAKGKGGKNGKPAAGTHAQRSKALSILRQNKVNPLKLKSPKARQQARDTLMSPQFNTNADVATWAVRHFYRQGKPKKRKPLTADTVGAVAGGVIKLLR